MTAQSQHVFDEALSLSSIEKAELVEKLLDSFSFPDRRQIDDLWAKEAEDRIAAYDAGKITSIPAARVFEKIEDRES